MTKIQEQRIITNSEIILSFKYQLRIVCQNQNQIVRETGKQMKHEFNMKQNFTGIPLYTVYTDDTVFLLE